MKNLSQHAAFLLAVELRVEDGMTLDDLILFMMENDASFTDMTEILYWMKQYGVVEQHSDGKLRIIGADFCSYDLFRVIRAIEYVANESKRLPTVKASKEEYRHVANYDGFSGYDTLSFMQASMG